LQTRTSKSWKCRPGGWDALYTEYIDFYEDYPVINCKHLEFDFIVNCNDNKNIRPGGLISTFLDDYHLERFWNNPVLYAQKFSRSGCSIMSPDFSLLIGMPKPMQMWNTYRNRFIGHFFTRYGCNVVPTITWSDSSSFEYCFNGVAQNSIVAVSNIGALTEEHDAFFRAGFEAMIRAINPSKIVFMANKKFGQRYASERVIFVSSFFNRRKKIWAEEQEKPLTT
jgi:hypothetical protein